MRACIMSRWIENETKLTSIFAGISAVSLILNITGVLKNILPVFLISTLDTVSKYIYNLF